MKYRSGLEIKKEIIKTVETERMGHKLFREKNQYFG